ncbi:conserved exported hypothetical protein [Gammaproteobacteria bacterium]
MHKVLSIIAVLFCTVLATAAFAGTLNIYDKPEANSKVIATMKSGEQLMPIFYTEKRDWVKVANPQNGDVGWAKVSELKGPMIITKVNGAQIHQQVIVDKDKGKQPQTYSIIQYSGTEELKPEEAKKVIKEVEERNKAMEKSMQKMREQIQKSMLEMFGNLDKNFYTFPIIQPIIVVPDNRGIDKAK